MKKWLFPLAVVLVAAAGVAAVVIWISLPSELPGSPVERDSCARVGIEFDGSSVLGIYQDPESILEDPASFWAEDQAYRLVAMAPRHRGASLPPDGWERKIERVRAMPAQARAQDDAYARAMEVMEHASSFCEQALPVIQSLLPRDSDLSTAVYLSAYTDPAYFAFRSSVVMDMGAPSYFGKTSKCLNLLAHEILHIGYFNQQPQQTEVWPSNYPLKVTMTTLQNDGLAVYTQSELASLYPAPAEIELLLLDSDLAVRLLLRRVNALLRDAETVPEQEIMGKVYKGANQRALYVVGAHMARTIDQALGSDALAETVAQGPRSFIWTYNSVARRGMEVHDPGEPEQLSPVQLLRQAALDERYESVQTIVHRIEGMGVQNPGGSTFEHLESTGLLLLHKDRPRLAVVVFQLLVSLYPEHPYAHLHLGDAYSHSGDEAKARASRARALELDLRVAPAAGR